MGFPRSGRNWQHSIHDVTGLAPALAQAWCATASQGEGHRGVCSELPGRGAQGLRCPFQSGPGHPSPFMPRSPPPGIPTWEPLGGRGVSRLLGLASVARREHFPNQEDIFPAFSDSPILGGILRATDLSGPGPEDRHPCRVGETCHLQPRCPIPHPLTLRTFPVERIWTGRATFFLLFWDFQFSAANTIFAGTF